MVSTCVFFWLKANGNTAPGEVIGSTQGELLWCGHRNESSNGHSLRFKAVKSFQHFGESSTDERAHLKA
jgi:hypothetical protein